QRGCFGRKGNLSRAGLSRLNEECLPRRTLLRGPRTGWRRSAHSAMTHRVGGDKPALAGFRHSTNSVRRIWPSCGLELEGHLDFSDGDLAFSPLRLWKNVGG